MCRGPEKQHRAPVMNDIALLNALRIILNAILFSLIAEN
jgi:hypothetical protein